MWEAHEASSSQGGQPAHGLRKRPEEKRLKMMKIMDFVKEESVFCGKNGDSFSKPITAIYYLGDHDHSPASKVNDPHLLVFTDLCGPLLQSTRAGLCEPQSMAGVMVCQFHDQVTQRYYGSPLSLSLSLSSLALREARSFVMTISILMPTWEESNPLPTVL